MNVPARTKQTAAKDSTVAVPTPPLVLSFDQIGKENVSVVGGKGANLGEMTRAGLPVPGGFVVTVEAYRQFLAQEGLEQRIQQVLVDVDPERLESLDLAAQRIAALIEEAPLPESVQHAIAAAYRQLVNAMPNGEGSLPFVAVRSSATAEDTARFSFAGMFQSFLNVRGVDALAKSVKGCWASAFGARVLFYRHRQDVPGDVPVAAVVQRMVSSEKSGVLFTVDPASGDTDTVVIEAAYGLGEVVVLGQVTPDHYCIDKATRRIVSRTLGLKPFQLVRDATTGETAQLEVGEPRRSGGRAERR